MNFYNEDEKKDGAAAPGAFKKTSSFGKAPLFSRTAGGLMDRLKNLSRKDMAFVGIGLSVLVMAPVAEYMMSKPSTDNILTPGFGSREGGAPTGLYEPGINALSQGSPDGSGEVITPLSSRDPASLILGSQPAAPAMPPPSAPPTTFRDSMKDVGRAAFTEASKAAPSPTPIPRMQAALRGMSSFFGGGDSTRTSGSLGGGKIIDDAKSASNKAAKRSMVGPVAMPGYKGVASNTPNSSSKGAFEKLRSAADKSAGNFTGGSAISSLDKAAADAPNVGAGGGGMGYGGDSEKTGKTSPYNNKYEHSRSGESLAEMAAKQRMQKALDWEFYKQYEIPKQLINAILTGITGPLTKFVDGTVSHIFGLDAQPKPTYCWQPVVCPTGDCDAKVKEYKVIAAVDLCYDPGAQKFSWEAAGKDKGSGAQVNCICGKQNQPIGKEYVHGTGTPPPGGPVVDTPPANGGGAGTPPGNEGSAGTPAAGAISADALKTFASYDDAFSQVIGNVIQAEKAVTEGKKPEELDKFAAALAETVVNLNTAAGSMVQPKLTSINADAQRALNSFSGEIRQREETLRIAKEEYAAYEAATAKMLKDIQNGTFKPAAAAEEGVVRDEKASINTQPVKDIIAAVEKKDVKGSLTNARGQLDAYNFRLSVFTSQVGEVGKQITPIIQAHGDALAPAKDIIADKNTPVAARLAKITGRPAAVAPATATPDAGAVKDAGAAVGSQVKTGAEQALAEGQKAPLRKVAEDSRGVKWDILWPPNERKFDSTVAAGKEVDAWKAFVGTINHTKKAVGQIPPTTNFVANAARSGAIQADVASVDFSNVDLGIDTPLATLRLAKEKLLASANACYFGKTGCSATGVGGGQVNAGGKVSAPMAMLRENLIRDMNITTDKYPAAQARLEAMPQALAGTPYAQASAVAQIDAHNLATAKADLDKKIAELRAAPNNAAVEKKAQEVRAAETAYKAAEAKFANSYQAAMQTPTGMNTNGAGIQAKKAQAIKYRSEIAAAYSRCTGTSFPQEVCRVGIADRIAQIEERAEQKEAVALSSNNEAELGRVVTFLSGERNTACGLISQAKTRCYAYPKASRQVCLDNFTKGVCGN